MTDRPPSPETPPSPAGIATNRDREELAIVTAAGIAAAVENALDYRPDEALLEDALVELDRRDYVEWVTVTPAGDHAWDVSTTADRVADAVAEAVVGRLEAGLQTDS